MNIHKPFSKTMALIIVLVMTLTLAPMTVFALEAPPPAPDTALAEQTPPDAEIEPLANSNYTIPNDTSTLESHRVGIQSLLTNAGSGNTVTVSGSRTDMAVQLLLTIPSGVTLIWQANLSGDTTTDVPILRVEGYGNFTMNGGSLSNNEVNAPTFTSWTSGTTLITGSAQITTAGKAAIELRSGTLTINGNAQISKTSTNAGTGAIHLNEGTSLTIGGSAQVSSAGNAIINSTTSPITVSDGSVSAGGYAIASMGNVTVSGGTVSSTANDLYAINAHGNITVSGTGTVISSTGNNSKAIQISNDTGGTVTANISGGTISAKGQAIYAYTTNRVDVTISGGTVSSANNYAIYNATTSSTGVVTVSGGEVTGSAAQTIYMLSSTNTAQNVVVSGSAKVRNTGTGNAIRSSGGVIVTGNALVAARVGNAIYSRDVTISGGAVFAYGASIAGSDNVVRATNTYTPPTANGIAIAWDSAAAVSVGNNYAQSSKLHITGQPDAGNAYWSKNNEVVGIQYVNGSASGHIPVSGVTIDDGDILPAASGVGISAGAQGFPAVGIAITGTYTYNAGAGSGAGTDSGSTFKWYRGNTATWNGAVHTAIPGAEAASYIPTADDIGKYLYFEVTPSNGTVTGATVRSAASAQAGVLINLAITANDTNGYARIAGTVGPTAYKLISATSPTLSATLVNALGVNWTVSSGGGTFTNDTALTPGYVLPTLSGITGAITITAAFTKDDQPPVLSGVSVNGITNQSAVLHFQSTKAGTLYYLVYAAAAGTPSADTIKAQGTAAPTVAKGSSAFSYANYSYSITMSGLTASTAYKVHTVVYDAANNPSSVVTQAFSTVELQSEGLVFDVADGTMKKGSGNYATDSTWSWNSGTKTLTLTNFNYVTSAAVALQVKNGDITLELIGSNSFISTYDAQTGTTCGIIVSTDITGNNLYATSNALTITGSGALEATSGALRETYVTSGNFNCGIAAKSLTLNSGTLTATGGYYTSSSYGIYVHSNGGFTMSGGELTARSGSGGSFPQAIGGGVSTVTLPAKYRHLANSNSSGSPGGEPKIYPGVAFRTVDLNSSNPYRYVWIQSIPLSTEKGLTTVLSQDVSYLGQTGTDVAPIADPINVGSGVATLSRADIVSSAGEFFAASFNLYSDSGFTNEVTGTDSIALTLGGATTVYIKVTAEDASEAHYAITVNRAPEAVVSIAEITGVTSPVYGATPIAAITATAEYTGTVTWSPNDSAFEAGTVYTATITLTPKSGFTLAGAAGDFFDVSGAVDTRNAADSGIVTAVFPATDAPPKDTGLAATDCDISITSSDTVQHDLDLDSIALNKANTGERSYALSTFTDSANVLTGAPSLLGSTLLYTGNGQHAGSATQIITISTANYEDVDVTITFNAIEKYSVTKVTITNSAAAYIYKEADAVHGLQHAVKIEPANATVKDVSWTSSDKAIATVNKAGLVTFTGKEGTVRITAASADGPSHFKDIKVVRNVTKIRTPL
ncbi:MAG: Ig-like domain-containing protein, partial [Clostridiales Family XIII bacterium]|nr:Ig-like domain-containing protein [Clostridiales Family XIII bacterium]